METKKKVLGKWYIVLDMKKHVHKATGWDTVNICKSETLETT